MMMRSSMRKSDMASCGVVASNKRRKKGASVPSCAASLPEEMVMVTEVLLRLPVKSILRFRAVCRSWAAMFSSEEFCSLHSTMAKAAPPKLLLISPTARFDSTTVYSCSSSGLKDDLLFTLDYARGNFVEGVTPAPCHGLTLLYDAVAPAYYICNAATRQVTRLPPFLDESATHRITTGLGFDARTKQYKVVRLINGHFFEKEMIKYEVYMPGGGGGHGDRWRPATGGVPFGLRRFANAAVTNAAVDKLQPVFANGFLHWLVRPSSFIQRPRAAVVSFSVTEETFTCVRSPPFWASGVPLPSWSRASGEHLVELDNHLCMVRDLRNNPYGSTLDIWRLLDYSSGDWSLNHRINLLGHVATDLREPQVVRVIGSVGSCKSGKKIIIATSKHKVHDKFQKKVHTYDPMSEALETILSITETHTSLGCSIPSSRFGLFEESLALVHKTAEEIALSSTLAKATKEILLSLPAKLAIQTQLVCKQWLRLIESENFIHSYYKHKNMDRGPKVMLVGKGTGQKGTLLTGA